MITFQCRYLLQIKHSNHVEKAETFLILHLQNCLRTQSFSEISLRCQQLFTAFIYLFF